MIDLTPTATDISNRIAAALPGVPIYWTAATVPSEEIPAEFIVLDPLFVTVNQSWGENTHARHRVQIRAAALTVGRATKLASDAQAALPATVYETPAGGPLVKVGQHYDMIVEAITHATGGGGGSTP